MLRCGGIIAEAISAGLGRRSAEVALQINELTTFTLLDMHRKLQYKYLDLEYDRTL